MAIGETALHLQVRGNKAENTKINVDGAQKYLTNCGKCGIIRLSKQDYM